jgi:lipopolysaccharide export system protein LptA
VSWRRNVRIGAGIVGLSVAAALFFMRRDRPPVAPPPKLNSVDPNSALESQSGEWVITKDDRRVGRLTYQRSRTYDDGRLRFEQASLKIEDDNPFELTAGVLEGKGQAVRGELPPEINASVNVRFSTPSGLRLDTETATFNNKTGVATMAGPLTFGRDRMSGSGTGGTYRRDAKTLEILADAHVVVAADKTGTGALDATAGTMVLNQLDHALHLDRTAVIRGDTQTMEGNRINLVLTDDEQAIKQAKLLGAAKITPKEGVANAGPAMSADAIDLQLRPDGKTVQRATLATAASVGMGKDGLRAPWIDVQLAPDGSTVVGLDARDGVHVDVAPAADAGARTIDARTLSSTGNPKVGLTAMRFEGSVAFGEAPSAPGGSAIKSTARALVLTLSGGLGAIDSAEFQGDARFSDGVVSATADRAIYDARKDSLELRPGPKPGLPRPLVQDSRVELKADAIDLNTQTHNVRAIGTAETQLLPDRSAAADSDGALFDRSRPILGSAPEVLYSSTTARAIYKSNGAARARVWQDANDVTADEITLDDKTQNLSATRRVVTVLEMAPANAPERSKPETYRIRSEQADFDQEARRATFKGKPVELSNADRKTEGQTLEFRLAAKSRSVEGFTMTGDVFSQLPDGREALSDRLEYDAAGESYKLFGQGKVALIKSQNEKGGQCAITRGLKIEIRGKTVISDGGGSNQGTDQIPCETPLRSVRR